MKNLNNKLKALLIMITLMVSGCVGDITDLNVNPNNPTDVPPEFIFPSGVAVGAYQIAGPLNRPMSFWVQHLATAGGQYQREDRYDVASTTFNNQWNEMYSEALNDFDIMIEKSEGLPNYQAVAMLMKAYYMQLITDLWGDVPYSEAFDGQSGNLNPAYDPQQDIYNSLISEVQTAIGLIDKGDDAAVITTQDFIYGGDLDQWEKFGNTLLLKLYIRLSESNPQLAEQGVTDILTSGVPLISSEADDAVFNFGTRAETNENPLSQQDFQRQGDYGASETIVNMMQNLNDPRIPIYFRVDQNGMYTGIPNGNPSDLDTDASGNTIVSLIGSFFVQESSPVFLLTYYERLFIEAEAAIRGWVNPGNAQQLYEDAVTAAINKYGVGVGSYLDPGQPANYNASANKLELLFTQKYIALFARGPEAYSEWRRSNVPSLTAPADAVSVGELPLRLPYSSDEQNSNSQYPGSPNIFNEPVSWDK